MQSCTTEKYRNEFPSAFRRDFMKPAGLSVMELAKRAGLDYRVLGHEINESRSMSRQTSAGLGRVFGKPERYFLDMQDKLDAPYRTVAASMTFEEGYYLVTALCLHVGIRTGRYDIVDNDMGQPDAEEQDGHVKAKRADILARIRDMVMPELAGRDLDDANNVWDRGVDQPTVEAYDVYQVLLYNAFRYQTEWLIDEPIIRGRLPRPVCRPAVDADASVRFFQGVLPKLGMSALEELAEAVQMDKEAFGKEIRDPEGITEQLSASIGKVAEQQPYWHEHVAAFKAAMERSDDIIQWTIGIGSDTFRKRQWEESGGLVMEMTAEQAAICRDAVQSLTHCLCGDFGKMFAMYTDDSAAIAMAEECEAFRGPVREYTDYERLLSKLEVAIGDEK